MENYALNLSRAPLETDGQNEYHLLFRQNVPPELASYSNRACFYLSPFNNQIAAEQLWIPFMERKLTPQLAHFPAFPPGVYSRTPKVAIIFDSTLWTGKARLSWKAKTYLVPLAHRAVRQARKILTGWKNSGAKYPCRKD